MSSQDKDSRFAYMKLHDLGDEAKISNGGFIVAHQELGVSLKPHTLDGGEGCDQLLLTFSCTLWIWRDSKLWCQHCAN